MDRHWDANGAAAAPAQPTNVLGSNVYPQAGMAPSQPGPWWFHMVTEEMRAVVEAGGLMPDRLALNQMAAAISAMITAQAPRFPAGAIIDHSGPTAPAGFLACPTSPTTLNRTTYADLFAAIGTTWGVGDGATTFGMPWFPADYAGVQANANVGTATVGAVIAHTHDLVDTNLADGSLLGNLDLGSPADNIATSTFKTGSTGGAANLAAGHRVLKCVKY